MFRCGMHSARLSRLVQQYNTLAIVTEVFVVFAQPLQVNSGIVLFICSIRMFRCGMHSAGLSRLVQQYNTLAIVTEVFVVFAQPL